MFHPTINQMCENISSQMLSYFSKALLEENPHKGLLPAIFLLLSRTRMQLELSNKSSNSAQK